MYIPLKVHYVTLHFNYKVKSLLNYLNLVRIYIKQMFFFKFRGVGLHSYFILLVIAHVFMCTVYQGSPDIR